MVKTYIPLPNFSTAPPPQGPLHLGSVVKTLKPSDILDPLNRRSRRPINANDIQPLDIKNGYRTTRKELFKGNFGIWAQLAGTFGVGIAAGVTYERGSDDVLTVERLETTTFIATDTYIRQALSSPNVRLYTSVTDKPVYLITGIKVARGASLESQKSVNKGAKLKLGFGSLGVQAGPDTGVSHTREDGFSFDGSSDFVIAVRVEKITVRKKYVTAETVFKGATLEGVVETIEEQSIEFESGSVVEDDLACLMADFEATEFVFKENGNDADEVWAVPVVSF